MKPDSWMPYYGNNINESMRGYGPEMLGSYVLALWHYWSHLHCSGLPNDDAYLRTLCGASLPNWARVKGVIFDNNMFFCLIDGKWHQKRAREEYSEAKRVYEAKVKGGETRQKQLSSTPDRTADRTPSTSPPSTGGVQPQPQEQLHSQPQKYVGKNESSPSSVGEWLENLKKNAAYEGIDVGREYGKMCAWCETNRKQPTRRRFINWLNRVDSPIPTTPTSGQKQHTVFEIKAFIEAKKKIVNDLKNKFCNEGPLSTTWSNEKARLECVKLLSEIKQLNHQLASMA